MASLNKVMLIGNVGSEVNVHSFDNGGKIGRFTIATNESYTNKQTGEKVENTEWHNIVVRNRQAETCLQYIGKGSSVFVEGRIKTRKYTNKDGIDVYTTEIHALNVTFLSTKKADNPAPLNEPPFEMTSSFNTQDKGDLPFDL